jgi:hypothetical protein
MVALTVHLKSSIEVAISECRKLGESEFRKKYDCGKPQKFWIEQDGRFPAKAVLYVAHRLEHPHDPRRCRDFEGSDKSVASPLRHMGFKVVAN